MTQSSSKELSRLLRGSSKTISTAESCTGGRISHLITLVSGSSGYFLGGVTSYSPSVKCSVLGVNPETIRREGIVSAAVASEMANGVRKLTGSSFSVSTTGWAEGDGDEHEPSGTVWIAVSSEKRTETFRFVSHLDREGNIAAFADEALARLCAFISSSDSI